MNAITSSASTYHDTRIGDWLQTYSGRCFWPLDPRADEVFLEDIAHSLAFKCRYGGHSVLYYSVAEHSVLVSKFVPKEFALWGLLHDAGEAFSSDVPRPLKRCLKEWAPIEQGIMIAICERFGLPFEEPACVKQVDLALTSDEREALMVECDRDWGELPPAVGATLHFWSPKQAEKAFLARYEELTTSSYQEDRKVTARVSAFLKRVFG